MRPPASGAMPRLGGFDVTRHANAIGGRLVCARRREGGENESEILCIGMAIRYLLFRYFTASILPRGLLSVRDQIVVGNGDEHRQVLAWPGCAATRSRAALMMSGPTIDV